VKSTQPKVKQVSQGSEADSDELPVQPVQNKNRRVKVKIPLKKQR
jgi:hypothetical protein